MKILLVQPNSSEQKVGFTSLIRPEPLALECLAGAVPEQEVQILDLRVDPQPLSVVLSSFQPELVGITGFTADVPRMLQLCQEVKSLQPEVSTVVGGYHATLCPQDFDRDFVDIIVLGEGEVTFRELVTALEEGRGLHRVKGIIYRHQGKTVVTPPRPPILRLDDLPLPARQLTQRYRQHYHFHFWENPCLMETARGCPYRCTFCAVWKFHQGKCRFKTPEGILQELRQISSPLICFADDNFLQDLERAERLCQLIKSEGIQRKYWFQARTDSIVRRPDLIKEWADIGLQAVFVGFEKFREEELVSINKKTSLSINDQAAQILRDNGVDIWGSFIVDPQWSTPDFESLIDYVRRLKITFPVYTVLTPLPGTAFFQEKFQELRTLNYEIYDFLHSVLPTRLPLKDFYSNMARLYSSTTLGLRELRERVRSGRIPASALGRIREALREVTNPQAYLKGAETT
jgi:radical SAM superfamily enzyme YgiQ (UPF0313 family)